ncbi:MAG: two-component regulator propeller domain-containing protein [Haliscomenobacter sp.]|uniref:hybrid sensor histidine kinase/response regulator transcription factor n=1 Tax=Haliscomenobacter sp. TaxID=2717303 RepID=UPI0029A14582|nr:two-component regulator propeller domain-containing protein [Haliscomenobacter sp.]MDX2070970.1 two-component regulator propeller domain-containing protein [Haliscomenobacter sp.]
MNWKLLIIFILVDLTFLRESLIRAQNPVELAHRFYTTAEGLPVNVIEKVIQDKRGFIWLATENGISKYDGFEFTNYYHTPFSNTKGPSSVNITTACFDKQGIMWIGTFGEGLNRFDPYKEEFEYFRALNKSNSLSNNFLSDIEVDHQGNIWIGTEYGLNEYNPRSKQFKTYFLSTKHGDPKLEGKITSLSFDHKKRLWIGTHTGGVYLMNQSGKISLVQNLKAPVSDILNLENEETWILTQGEGTVILDTAMTQKEVISIKSHSDLKDNYHFCATYIAGKIWLSTSLGLNVVEPVQKKIVHQVAKLSNTVLSSVVSIFYDRSGIVWLGTEGRGLIQLKPKKITTAHFLGVGTRAFFKEKNGDVLFGAGEIGLMKVKESEVNRIKIGDFTNFGVNCILKDRNGFFWIGTDLHGLLKIQFRKNEEAVLLDELNKNNGLTDNYIWALYQDKYGGLWVGTKNGFSILDLKDNKINKITNFPFFLDNPYGLLHNEVRSFLLDSHHKMWIGTRGGVNRFDCPKSTQQIKPSTLKMEQFLYDEKSYKGINSNSILSIIESKDQNIWIATGTGGLNKYNPVQEKFEHYFPNEGVGVVQEDTEGNLWFTHNFGIWMYNPHNKRVLKFSPEDGLYDSEYVGLAVHQAYDGELFFGGINSFVRFYPKDLISKLNTDPPGVHLIDFQLLGKMTEGDRHNYHADLAQNRIKLSYRHNSFVLKFVALDFFAPGKTVYKYRLKGYSENWINTNAAARTATYTRVPPGHYTFQVIAANGDGIWNKKGATLQIIIRPPWYRTWWAYSFYILVFFGVVMSIFRYQRDRLRLRIQLQMEQREAERLKELDTLKTNLYANITHEFRTPLTAILGANDQIRIAPEKWLEPGTSMIQRNGQQLLDLINQMLDLSKLETGKMNSHWIQGDIVAYLRYIFDSFHSLAASKALEMHFLVKKESVVMDYDPEKLLRIMNNLLSNSIKFTPSNGQIYLQVDQVADLGGALELKLRDTGIGIAEDKLPHIFDRFYQVDDSTTRRAEGTGIGLALVREMIRHLQGTISVESEPGKGTIFTLQLPIHQEAKLVEESNFQTLDVVTGHDDKPLVFASPSEKENKLRVLIIEDNADVVHYLQACLADRYQVLAAINGEEGIQKAIAMVPDAIISDVMMPIKDGFAVTSTLKDDEATSHIPIILLTAKADVESRIQGLRRGADDYLAKPFNKEELLVRLENLIVSRAKLQKRYASITQIPEPSEDINLQKEDEFIQKVRQVLEQNYTEAEFKSPQFQRAMGMGRTQLHNKLKALTNLSTTEVINQFRVQKGRGLLETTSMNVSEVAYAVGYNDPKYFSERYFEEFGERPSEIINRR